MSVQQTIISGIKEQLFFNNYLVLPDFGGFVLKTRSAHFSATGGMIIAPSKTVSFNVQLKQNDGILTSWLQKKLSCTPHDALTHIKDFSEFCATVLNSKRRLSIEGIGFFYLDFENNICFEPQSDTNFLTSSFGLSPVSLTPLEVNIHPGKQSAFVDRIAPVQSSTNRTVVYPNFKKLVLPLLLTGILITLLSLLVANTRFDGTLRSSLFGNQKKGLYIPSTAAEIKLIEPELKRQDYVADANGVAVIRIIDQKVIAVKVTDEIKSNSNPIEFKSSGHYEVVLGCFSIEKNAERMLKKLKKKGVTAKVCGKNAKGMYVVCSGRFDSKISALQRVDQLRDCCPKAWVKLDQ